MFTLIYIEEEIIDHPKVKALTARFRSLPIVTIGRYMEVFNRSRQNFRLQKRLPALIIAKKYKNFVLSTPPNYGIGTGMNYYFSHLMNCPFDCRYCFLQGMFPSAHFVYFVNQEDFQNEVLHKDSSDTTFFTGYDCDSLAFESITGFVAEWLPFIATLKGQVEFRTKSTYIRPFLEAAPFANCVISYTLTPHVIGKRYESRAPSLGKRLEALRLVQRQGWKIGLRFDPVIPCPDGYDVYETFFQHVFAYLSRDSIHSVSLGGFRVPEPLFKKMVQLYPKEPLFADENVQSAQPLLSFCEQEILKYVPKERFFPCYG